VVVLGHKSTPAPSVAAASDPQPVKVEPAHAPPAEPGAPVAPVATAAAPVQLVALPSAPTPPSAPAVDTAAGSPAHVGAKATGPATQHAAVGPAVVPTPAAKPAAKGPVNCNPPFTIDAMGVKHPKMECM
jgi:hypothetical protein